MAEIAAFDDRPTPTENEMRLAAIMHLATIPAPIWGPLVGIAVSQKSRYLRAHAIQSLKETILLNIALGIAMVSSLVYTISRLWHFYQNDWEGFSLVEFIARFLVGWILLAILAVVNAVMAVRAAQKANQGIWPGRQKRR